MTFPKIELHVHLEGTMRPDTLLEIARRTTTPFRVRIGGEFDWRSLP